MSIWTSAHIDFVLNRQITLSNIERVLGHARSYSEILYESENFGKIGKEYIDVCGEGFSYRFLPEGSEGTLNIVVKKTTRRYTHVTICGALRDVDNSDAILSWFNGVIARNNEYRAIVFAKGWAKSAIESEPVKFYYNRWGEHLREEIPRTARLFHYNAAYLLTDAAEKVFKRRGKQNV